MSTLGELFTNTQFNDLLIKTIEVSPSRDKLFKRTSKIDLN
jgi:hypothetical protein